VNPDKLQVGMRVQHARYGPGEVIQISELGAFVAWIRLDQDANRWPPDLEAYPDPDHAANRSASPFTRIDIEEDFTGLPDLPAATTGGEGHA
jgi:hypothetical protein